MKKKIGAFGARQFSLGTLVGGQPGTTIFQNPGGQGGWGGVAYKDPARPPPPWLGLNSGPVTFPHEHCTQIGTNPCEATRARDWHPRVV